MPIKNKLSIFQLDFNQRNVLQINVSYLYVKYVYLCLTERGPIMQKSLFYVFSTSTCVPGVSPVCPRCVPGVSPVCPRCVPGVPPVCRRTHAASENKTLSLFLRTQISKNWATTELIQICVRYDVISLI